MQQRLEQRLRERKAAQLYRERRLLETATGPEVRVDGKTQLLFCSNDYLGLAQHPRLIEAGQQALAKYGAGSGASHLVSGHSRLHHALEDALAEFTGRDRTVLFSTGYMANQGVMAALLGRGDVVLQDRLNHASLIDGARLSGAKFQRFQHNDLNGLEARLADDTGEPLRLVAVDAVYSMDGDMAPLAEMAALCQQHEAVLMADDAHGFGVLGASGAGSAEHWGLNQQQLPILMGTLGKAAGSFGAFVAGSEALAENLLQFARSYIYTTALPPAVASSSLAALHVIAEEGWRRGHLHTLIKLFRSLAEAEGLPLMASITAIQPLLLGDEARALQLSEMLAERGFWVSAIRPPTVPQGTARLRITLSAAHSEAQVRALVAAISECWQLLANGSEAPR